jgi:hypothetical protein
VTCPHAFSDGAYVLGALSPTERTAFEAHLPGCDSCARAVARLAPVPGLLGRVDPATLQPNPPGPSRLPRLLASVTQQRRRQTRVRRWQLAAAALAATVLAVAGSAGVVWLVDREPPASTPPAPPPLAATSAASMRPVDASVPVTAQLAMAATPAGTEVWMACQYPEPTDPEYGTEARTFRLVAVGMDGTSEQVGSWLAAPGDELSLTGWTKFTGEELARVELRDAGGHRLLTYDVE